MLRQMPSTDEFEAKNMQGDEPVLHRDKKVSRGMAGLLSVGGLLVILLAAYVAIANGTASRPVPPAALPFVVAAVTLLGLLLIATGVIFAVVRTVVTAREVHVKYGLWGPRIPLDAIQSCKVIEYDWTEFGGWGLRRGKDGTWAYVPGGPRVVELRYVERGVAKRVLFAGDDVDGTARAINRARLPEPEARKLRIEETSGTAVEEAADEESRGARETR